MQRSFIAVFVLGLAGAIVACVSEQNLQATPPAPQPDASVSSDGGADGAVGATRDFGIFLSSELFPSDFGKDTTGALDTFVDGKCSALAEAASLPNASRYRAMMTVGKSVNGESDLPRIASFQNQGKTGDRWCAIRGQGTTFKPDCTTSQTGIIFSDPEQFLIGPVRALLTTELGLSTGEGLTRFWSGVRIDPDSPRIRNCFGWTRSVAEPFDAGPSFYQYEVGIGVVNPVEGNFMWAGAPQNAAKCLTSIKLPLLCIEQPP